MAAARFEFLDTHPEVTAGFAVVLSLWFLVAWLFRSEKGLARASYEDRRRTLRAAFASALAVAMLVSALRVDSFDAVGKLNFSLLPASCAIVGAWGILVMGRLADAPASSVGTWRQPVWTWWPVLLGTAHTVVTVIAVVRVEPWAIGTTQHVSMWVVGAFSCAAGVGTAVAALRFRAPVAAGT